jgi:UDP-galactopyranose mutase
VKATILGGGFAGTTVAHLLAKDGWHVELWEKEPHLGGGCRTFFQGGHPFTYGPRLYYGYSDKVFKWVDSIIKIRRFPFELLTYVERDSRFYSYPIHEEDIQQMPDREEIYAELAARDNSKEPANFDEYWLQRVGRRLYDKFVNNYSKKMWMIEDNKIFDIFKWSAKDKAIETGTKEAYKGSYIGYPVNLHAYNPYFDKMVEGVEVITNRRYTHGDSLQSDIVVSTIPIDEFCGYRFGELPYVGRDFSVFILPTRQAFPGDVRFCHYAGQEAHTRITEFKKITYYDSPDSLFVLETPSKRNKLYPYLTKANMALTAQYLGSLPENVHSIGRLGTYKYSTIEQTIVQAFECFAKITGKPNPMDGEFFGIGDTSLMKDRKEETGLKRVA